MNDYVAKPVARQALAAALSKWLPHAADEGNVGPEDGGPRGEAVISPATPVPPPAPLNLNPATPIFDRAGMLARLMDDEELIRLVVDGFLEDLPRQITALKAALEARDAPGVERQAHTLKGASANVGGERLREVAYEMEQAARAGDLNAAGIYLAELEAEGMRLTHAMTEVL